jgi:DNA-binding phage protein
MEEADSLDFLIGVQGEIKRCRELADLASDRKLAADLYRLSDKMEQQVRELDRL